MNRSKDPQVSLCERKFILDAIKENKVGLGLGHLSKAAYILSHLFDPLPSK